jgi:hypothetical protein
MIFEQQLKADYWEWSADKKKWFDRPLENKNLIFQEIYARAQTIEGEKKPVKIALIIHDKDKNDNGESILPHVHGYVEYGGQRDLHRLANALGIKVQYVEPTGSNGGNKWGKINSQAYLIHAKQPDKFQYLPEEVETFGTIDYLAFIKENKAEFQRRSAKVKRQTSDESLDLILQKVQSGELLYNELMLDDTLSFLYANNQLRFKEAFDFYGERSTWLRLEDLRQERYSLTVLYIQGQSGIGKTTLANKIALKVKEKGRQEGFNSEIFSASSKNPFDDYYGEDIVLLDDLRPHSLSASDYLKLFDPLNSAKMAARYKNRLVVPRLIIVSNYQSPENFFSQIKGENINQFIRRLHYSTKISEKSYGLSPLDKLYTLSQIVKYPDPHKQRITEREYLELNFGAQEIVSTDNQEHFIHKLIEEIIFPRSFKQKISSPTS